MLFSLLVLIIINSPQFLIPSLVSFLAVLHKFPHGVAGVGKEREKANYKLDKG